MVEWGGMIIPSCQDLSFLITHPLAPLLHDDFIYAIDHAKQRGDLI
jgi:hypothetical protein